MTNNFWCTNWRSDRCILYILHIQEKSRKGSAQRWTEFFTDSKTDLGAFFTPKRNTRVNDFYQIWKTYTHGVFSYTMLHGVRKNTMGMLYLTNLWEKTNVTIIHVLHSIWRIKLKSTVFIRSDFGIMVRMWLFIHRLHLWLFTFICCHRAINFRSAMSNYISFDSHHG